MDSTKLETFLLVCKEKSFTKAAEKLFITPAAIKKQIDALEEEVGVKLVHRSPTGCSLTVGGQVFYDRAKNILKYIHASIEQVRLADQAQYQELRVGHSLKFDYGFISKVSESFADTCPGKYLRFERMAKSSLYTALQNHTIDCFFYINPQKNDFPDVLSESIGTTKTHAVVRRRHPLASQGSISAADLHGYDIYISSVLDYALYDLLDASFGANLHILDKEDRNNLMFNLQHNAVILYPCPVAHDVSIPFDYPPMEIRIYYLQSTPVLTELLNHLRTFFHSGKGRILI